MVRKERRRALRQADPGGGNRPIRSELFSDERLAQHAISLAEAQKTSVHHLQGGHSLLARTRENEAVLLEAYESIARTVAAERAITPAAEWLLDNFHVIEEQAKAVAAHLPDQACAALPRLDRGFLAGYPRVYGIAWALMAHTDSRFTPASLSVFLRAYQQVQPLAIGELWAIPAILRVMLLENLRRHAVLVMRSQEGRQLADDYVDQLERHAAQADTSAPLPAPPVLPPTHLRQAFAVQLAQRLHDPHPATEMRLEFLDGWLAEEGVDLDEVVRREHAAQVSANWTVRNLITSMRAVSAFDWPPFIEGLGLVDEALRGHAGYAQLDFLTRDRYRQAVAQIAQRSPHSELEIARQAMATARHAGPDPRRQEPGYYLIGAGRSGFEQDMGFRPSLRQRLLRAGVAHATAAYLGGIGVLALLLLAFPLVLGLQADLDGPVLALVVLLGALPALDLAAGLTNRAVLALLPPRHLPRFEFKDGPPAESRCCVALPALLADAAGLRERLGQLEVHYLANPEGAVHFVLLCDWPEADGEALPEDARLLEQAQAGVAALNARYGAGRFFLCLRRRQWNPALQQWAGWEGERGRWREFNRLLRGAEDTSFLMLDGQGLPPGIRYVIALDPGTRLPIGAVARLAGTAAHPLNRPVLDPATRRVSEGYAILQPRMVPTLPQRREHSLYRRIFGGESMDAQAGAASEAYQNLFGVGTYLGKGLYDVDAFEAALAGRDPPQGAAQGVFEGVFARCARVEDIALFEDFPAHAQTEPLRAERRALGAGRLWAWALGPAGRDASCIGRWKLLDPLRRALSAPAGYLALAIGWALPTGPRGALVGLVLAALALPSVLACLGALAPPRRGLPLGDRLREFGDTCLWSMGAALVNLILLAQRAWPVLAGVPRRWRQALGHARPGWTVPLREDPSSPFLRLLWPPLLRSGLAAGLAAVPALAWNPAGLPIAAPVLLLWALAPLFVHALSLPPPLEPGEAARPDDLVRLRQIARRTWRFFETFVTADDHHLPPDNFQEDPRPVLARRSSPTNFGMYLLAALSARDFGWLGLLDCVERLEASLGTLDGMPRLRGHFYNWYDTSDLRPLEPRYVSTVDSGNLAGHLIALAQGCRELARAPLNQAAALEGIVDTHGLLLAALDRLPTQRRTLTVPLEELRQKAAQLGRWLAEAPRQREAWEPLWRRLLPAADTVLDLARAYAAEHGDPADQDVVDWAGLLAEGLRSHARDLDSLLPRNLRAGAGLPPLPEAGPAGAALADRLESLAETAERLFRDMDFSFLYDPERHLFSLGYRVAEDELDSTYYDLMASEARLASQIAIAKHEVPAVHWSRLGRRMVRAAGGNLLLSWSGSMFEYLMPSLIGFTPRHSLLDRTCRRAVRRQIEYGRARGVPWGISESAFSARDPNFTYQYSAFGVPGLGMKRGLARDLVIAPYATALAALYYPRSAAENYARLESLGAMGRHGFYEALDFTPSRLAEGQRAAVVRCYMAHHQGMSLAALANALHNGILRRRFHAAPLIRATELLLQERSPRGQDTRSPRSVLDEAEVKAIMQPPLRQKPSPTAASPDTHLLSNGRYSVLLTAAGSGYSEWEGLAVTRWRPDATLDGLGTHLYLRDVETGKAWSAGYQPTAVRPERYEAVFLEDRARIVRTDGGLATALEVVVSPEDPAELRRLSLTNHGSRAVEVEATSYAELALAPARSDAAHPAFAKLFVGTEFVAGCGALLAHRRAGPGGPEMWAAHLLAGGGEAAQFETDRARFVGRGRTLRAPLAVEGGGPLGCSAGPVLDPVFSLRARLKVAPGATVHATFVTLAGPTRAAVLALAEKYRGAGLFERASALAWTQAQVQLRHLGTGPDEARLFQALAARLLYPVSEGRPGQKAAKLAAPALWRLGLSGERPLALLRVASAEDRPLVEQLLRAHEYWRSKRLEADLVVLCEEGASYAGELWNLVEGLLRARRAARPGQGGGVLALRADLLSEDERALLRAAARVSLAGGRGTLAEQVLRRYRADTGYAPARTEGPPRDPPPALEAPPGLEFFNGLGGFADGGREYLIALGPGQCTPAPWINVLANPSFGCMVSESGGGSAWSLNSRENPLTPWSNDPVSDPPGEAFYLRDEDSGALWSPTALPIRVAGAGYLIRHGQGYSRFEHASHGIHSELLVCVDPADPVKVSRLTLRNDSGRLRRLAVAAYAEWALGLPRESAAPHVVTWQDPDTGALCAANPWSAEFGQRVAFADLSGARLTSWTCSRVEFLGRNGALDAPAGLLIKKPWGRRAGPGLDPCAALLAAVELAPGASAELVFLLGQGANQEEATALVRQHRPAAAGVLERVRQVWEPMLDTLQISTPDRGLDLLVNSWLPYQSLSCRVWARAAFYQAGGAYGFRDQLQDVMALAVLRPELARAHILRAAERQFPEGDVQHWWHPPLGRGVRTHCSDDRVWLPYAVAHYLAVTGDAAVLDEALPFLVGQTLAPGQEDAYFEPGLSEDRASLYEHCARALDVSLLTGAHGLPLMGNGDWNDGMNRVGAGGHGESVWLAWFLIAALESFAPVAEARGDRARVQRWREHVARLRTAAEAEAWDGAWYRRAFFDDGEPLGSAASAECCIDSIAQSWAVISGAADPERARRAMDAVQEYLVRRGDDLVLLFTPPFDRSAQDPGYVKAYPPGIRENGGQYTHAAVWCAVALAELGEGGPCAELLRMLNPAHRAATRAGAHAYKVEPYVLAADIYSEPPHARRGGWTWYTGAAGWFHRAAVEWLLGFRVRAGFLELDPRIPKDWPGYAVRYRQGAAVYEVTVENPQGAGRGIALLELDGVPQPGPRFALRDDGKVHRVRAVLG